MCDAQNSDPGLGDSAEGQPVVGGGREVQMVCISVADSCFCMAKTNTAL